MNLWSLSDLKSDMRNTLSHTKKSCFIYIYIYIYITCEKCQAYLRISDCHLLMNLKNNYLLKELLKWANKNCKNIDIYNVDIITTWRFYTCVPKILMIWSTVLEIKSVTDWNWHFGNYESFLPFHPPENPKNQNFEKMKKNAWRYYHFIHVYHKWKSYDGSWYYGVRQTIFFIILRHFCRFTSLTTQKKKILKT